MGRQVYQDSDFKVYRAGKSFVVHNIHKPFANGHTHMEKYDTCMALIKLVERKQLPKSKSKHFLESILRVSDDNRYINLITQQMIKLSLHGLNHAQ
jgi:hypothetical protein